MLNDAKGFTKNGNMKSPGFVRAMQWIIECWNELDRELIINSFDGCGITCSNEENFNSLLRYVLNNGHTPGSYIQNATGSDDFIGFNQELIESENEYHDESSSDDDASSVITVESSSNDELENDSYELDQGAKTSKKPIRNKSKFLFEKILNFNFLIVLIH